MSDAIQTAYAAGAHLYFASVSLMPLGPDDSGLDCFFVNYRGLEVVTV